jgi:hypothetical protein
MEKDMLKKISYTSLLIKIYISTSLVILLSVLLSSCLPAPARAAQVTPNLSTIESAAIQSVTALAAHQTPTGNTPRLTPTETGTPRFTPLPTNIPQTQTPQATSIPCYGATFVKDVNVPEGTQLPAGARFTKVWRLQNTGTCTWTPDFKVLFVKGDNLGGPSSFNLPETVSPGQTVDISVNLTAPQNNGSFEGFYQLETSHGTVFGSGPSNAPFDVQVLVGQTQVPFTVSGVDLSVNTAEIATTCPPGNVFKIKANIQVKGEGNVGYFWEFSDNTQTNEKFIPFDDVDSLSVAIPFTANHSASFWARLHITQPSDMRSDMISFTLNCQTPSETPTP